MDLSNQRWQKAIADLYDNGEGFVLVTILETKGSSPRNSDSKMVVTRSALFDSIGGGQLEYRAVDMARQMLCEAGERKHIEAFPLGPSLNQCCGGYVKLLFEAYPACHFNIQLYGAGHVARALVKILGDIDCRVRWIDERDDVFAEELPDNILPVSTSVSVLEVETAPADAWHLVMTHSHSLDLELCEAVLSRNDIAYLGLIGSSAKARRFRKRLLEKGFNDRELLRLHCPVGLRGISGKAPMQIAVSIAAEMLRRRSEAAGEAATVPLELVTP